MKSSLFLLWSVADEELIFVIAIFLVFYNSLWILFLIFGLLVWATLNSFVLFVRVSLHFNKYLKSCSIFLVTWEIKIKTTMKYIYTVSNMAEIKNTDNTNYWQECRDTRTLTADGESIASIIG